MALSLPHKRTGKSKAKFVILSVVVMLLLIAMFIFFFPECRQSMKNAIRNIEIPVKSPYKYPDSIWISESPEIVLHVSPDKDVEMGSSGGSKAYIIVEDEKIPVDILIERGRYAIICKEGKHDAGSTLLGGHLNKVTNKEVIIQIQEDYVYGGKYTEITLKRASP